MSTALDTTTATTIGGIFPVWDEGCKESFSRATNSSKGTRILRCLWNERLALANFLYGSTSIIGGIVSYTAPQAYPDQPNWIVNNIETEGDGILMPGPFGQVAYERSKLTVMYSAPEWNNGSPNQIGEQELDFSSSSIALSSATASFNWADGALEDLPPSMVPVLSYTTVQFCQSVHEVPVLPTQLIISLVDKSNSVAFFGAPAETVVFRGGKSRRKISAGGDLRWSLDYSFEYTPLGDSHASGWNAMYDPVAKHFRPYLLKNGNKLFPPMDLNQLFA